MKYTLTLLLTLIALSAKSQSLLFEIKPVVYKTEMITEDTLIVKSVDTCNRIQLTICGIGTDSACVNYAIFKESGMQRQSGTVTASLQAVAIAIQRPLNLTNVNMILRLWNIEAIRQITDDE